MVKVGWNGRRSVYERRQEARALLASGLPSPLPGFELTQGSLSSLRFYEAVQAAGHQEVVRDSWPTEASTLGDVPGMIFRDGNEAVLQLKDGSIASVDVGYGWAGVRVAAASKDNAIAAINAFRAAWPASYLQPSEPDGRIPMTFWTLGKFGPSARLRKIDAARWDDVRGNYTTAVRDEVESVMRWENGPSVEGQLLLWHGPPGTGKSWVLRALASEWAPWAEFNYITDPDSFFITDPSYMIDVLLADSYATIEVESGDVYEEQREGKWRVLLLEDTGELLAADAKAKTGQGLSRLLNVVDGMIGQGLRVLVVVTTNDQIEEMHPAVTRPGRCASMVEFGPLSPQEASEWLGEDTDEGGTLAELYARRTASRAAFPEADEAMAAAGQNPAMKTKDRMNLAALDAEYAAAENVKTEVARVAAEHQPDEPSYGQTAYDAENRRVLWVSWDGTSVEEHDAAEESFLELDGVDDVRTEPEGLPDGWWEAEIVYPENPPAWVTDRSLYEQHQAERVMALARDPLPELAPDDHARLRRHR